MNRRIFALGCLAALAAGDPASGLAARAQPSPTRWSRLRRKLMRSHVVILLVAGVAIGVGAWWHRPGKSGSRRDSRRPWERN